jgi:hypothetical protein
MSKFASKNVIIIFTLLVGISLMIFTWNDGYVFIQYVDHVETVTIKQFWQNGGWFNRQYNGEHYLLTSRPSYTAIGWVKLFLGFCVYLGVVYVYFFWNLSVLNEKRKKIFGVFKKTL